MLDLRGNVLFHFDVPAESLIISEQDNRAIATGAGSVQLDCVL